MSIPRIIVAGLIGCLVATPVLANNISVTWRNDHIVMRFSHDEITTPDGRSELLEQVERAIRQGCRSIEPDSKPDACFDRVWSTTLAGASDRVSAALKTAVAERGSAH